MVPLGNDRRTRHCQVNKIEAKYRERLKILVERHIKKLESAKTYYSKKGNFESAWKVKEEIERLQALLGKGDEGLTEIAAGFRKE